MEIGGVFVRKYIIKRILISIVILFFVAFIIYALMRCLPTSYIENMARQKSMQPGSKSFDEWMEQLTAMYNMDKGIVYGFFAWIGQMFRGEFGDSWFYTVPVIQKFNSSIWISFWMGLVAMVLELIIAIPLGVIAATKQYSKTDYTISLPTFFFASLLKLLFSVKLGWFDLFGLTGRNYEQLSAMGQFLDKAHHLVLPIVTLVVISVGSLMRYTRTNMLEVLNADYIRTARAKGLNEKTVIYHHAFRNTLIPPGHHRGRLSAGPLLRRPHYRDPLLHPRHRLCFLSGHGGRRHPLLHVLSHVPGHSDAGGQPDLGYPLCRGRSPRAHLVRREEDRYV